MIKIILASNSPRRSELLALMNLAFEVRPADINEDQQPGEPPVDYVRRMACQKAQAIAADQAGLVIAADTIVVDEDVLLGKPADPAEARAMLVQLRGRVHQVYTAIAIVEPRSGQAVDDVCRTDVPMREYTDAEIEAYIVSGDPFDKAGGYGIQNADFHPVSGLQGCFASVMGLPLCHLAVGLRAFGIDVTAGLPDRCQTHISYQCPVYSTILGRS
ncbi:MAG: Maf family protein [Brevefilum sp.]